MNNKTIMGGLAGGVAFFLLGWIIYGMMLMEYMSQHTMAGLYKPESEMMGTGMIWMILSNLLWGYFIATIFSWAGVSSVSAGVQKGAMLGLLVSASYDMGFMAMTNMYDTTTMYVIDIVVTTLMAAIAGAVVAWVMNRGAKSE